MGFVKQMGDYLVRNLFCVAEVIHKKLVSQIESIRIRNVIGRRAAMYSLEPLIELIRA
jgi:hypothetical protein